MNGSFRVWIPTCLALAALCACGGKPSAGTSPGPLKVAPDVAARRARFVQQTLNADTKGVPAGDLAAVDHLVRAAGLVDAVFRRQACPGCQDLAQRVETLTGPDAQAAKDYFRIMMGPWDRLKGFEPFLGDAARPAGAGFYPEDMTKKEFESWLASHPGDRKELTSPVTVVRRRGADLVAVPYSQEYRDLLAQVAAELKAAAAATANASLKKFLDLRAEAFISDDYYTSELAWMDLDGPIQAVIGPYDPGEDGLFGTKAAFKAFVCVDRKTESDQVSAFKTQLPFLESRLPIPDEHKNTKRGSETSIRVADVVATGGQARRGVQAMAFALPTDERVREARGSRKVLLRNMMRAKYDAILTAVAARTLPAPDLTNLSFESYYHRILFHEMSHDLGPSRIKVGGRDTEVRQELKELYGPIEEAKADVLSVFTLAVLTNKGLVPVTVVMPLPWTYLADLFRAARFGAGEAYGAAVVIEINYLLSKGSIEVTPEGRFRPVLLKFAAGIRDLAHDLLMIEAQGSYAGAQELVNKYGAVSPAMAKVQESLRNVPVDVDPVFAVERGAR